MTHARNVSSCHETRGARFWGVAVTLVSVKFSTNNKYCFGLWIQTAELDAYDHHQEQKKHRVVFFFFLGSWCGVGFGQVWVNES